MTRWMQWKKRKQDCWSSGSGAARQLKSYGLEVPLGVIADSPVSFALCETNRIIPGAGHLVAGATACLPEERMNQPVTKTTMRSLERALDVLGVLETHVRSLRLSEIAREVGLPVSTTQRILQTLEVRGLVERFNSSYQIGIGIVPMAHAFLMGNRLSTAGTPVLQELAAQTGLTASLFARSGMSRIVVARVQGSHPLRYVLPIGERLPLHLGAGRVFAADMTTRELDDLLASQPDMRFASGISISEEEFRSALVQIRQDGYLVARSERVRDITSVSAPIKGPDDHVLGVVIVSGHDLDESTIKGLIRDVRLAAGAIAQHCNATMGASPQ